MVLDPTIRRTVGVTDKREIGLTWPDFIKPNNKSFNCLHLEGYPVEVVHTAILKASESKFCGLRPILVEMEKRGMNLSKVFC